MKSIYKENIFDINLFNKIKKVTLSYLDNIEKSKYVKEVGRYYNIMFFDEDLKSEILKIARHELKDNSLDIAYCQAIKYQIQDGAIPKLSEHRDTASSPGGCITMDILIDSTIDWPLIIEGNAIQCKQNSVIFLNGIEDSHWRNPYPSNDEKDYVILLFIHLAQEGDPALGIGRKISKLPKEIRENLISKYRVSIGSYDNNNRWNGQKQ
jgi:hypothetical protein